jgi:hypothetical protein
MTATSFGSLTRANSGAAILGVRNAETGITNFLILECLKTISPTKPWAVLMKALGLTARTAKHRTDGDRKFSTGELALLLRSEDGFKFLVAVMADAQPTWWRVCRPLMEVAETQKMQAAARRRLRHVIEGAVNADREISATIQRAEAALCVQDEDFYRPQFAGARASARPSDRPMAQAARRK